VPTLPIIVFIAILILGRIYFVSFVLEGIHGRIYFSKASGLNSFFCGGRRWWRIGEMSVANITERNYSDARCYYTIALSYSVVTLPFKKRTLAS